MRLFTVLTLVLISFPVVWARKKPKKLKEVYSTGSGTITTKSMLADIEMVSFKSADGKTYTCMMGGAFQNTPDPRFRDFRQGDIVTVAGYKAPDSLVFGRCRIVMWTSTGPSQ